MDNVIHVDGGMVELYDAMQMPPWLKAVNVARASFAKSKNVFEKVDEKLLTYLAKHLHTSPFRHSPITLHVRCPEVIARQWYKHIVGSDYTFKDTAWNEVSGRYVPYREIYMPTELHLQSENKKQGASPEVHKRSDHYLMQWKALQDKVVDLYNAMVDDGIANEEARIVLPMGLVTEFYWTASPQALQHFVKLRNATDAQGLMQQYGRAVDEICKNHYGVLWHVMMQEM